MKFAFFGTPNLASIALSQMESLGMTPSLIITTPDTKVGRKQILTPPATKIWAEERGIPVFQPTSLKNKNDLTLLTENSWDIFVVFAYGKILPNWLLSLPKYGTINAHPSLLPKLRGASPIRSTLLNDLNVAGVTIIQMDAEMDHGPILIQQPISLPLPIRGQELDRIASLICGDLLVQTINGLTKGTITPKEQDHESATFCTKITKDMAELSIDPHSLPTGTLAIEYYRKICAFDGWPETFFIHNGTRIKIKNAFLDPTNTLVITRIVPEGKKETDFKNYFK